MKPWMYLAALGAATALAPAARAQLAIPALSRPDLQDMGMAPAATPVTLAITLKYSNQAALDALVLSQATPGAANYHKYLTPAQFAAQFAPSQADHDAVVAAVQQAGLTVARDLPNRTVIDVTGSAAAVSAFFQTEIHAVNQAGHGMRYANMTPATVPAGLAGRVSAVLGLDNVVKMQTHGKKSRVVKIGIGAPIAAPARATQPIERLVGGVFEGLYPAAFAAAYKYPAVSGAGHAIGIVIDSDIAQSSLTTYWKAAGVTRTGSFNRVLVNGSNPGVGADSDEAAIDTETTSSLAPGADIYVYLTGSLSDADIEDAYNLAITNANLDVISSSFGGCEITDTPFAQASNQLAEQGAAIGLTFTASTGDQGGYCVGQTSSGATFLSPDIINAPASSPYFVAVGGTTLVVKSTTGARTSETAWSPGGKNGGGTGGVSSYFALPSYQSGVTGIKVVPTITVTGNEYQPNSGFAGRNVPDISLDASNGGTSYLAVYDGSWVGYGGTSVSSPVFAALVALNNTVNGGLSGFLNPGLYATYTANGTKPAGVYGTDFYDVTKGSIGGGWSARKGYDQATGIGSINNGKY